MMNKLTGSVLGAALLLAASAVQASDGKDFIGFWEGMDEADGSEMCHAGRRLVAACNDKGERDVF